MDTFKFQLSNGINIFISKKDFQQFLNLFQLEEENEPQLHPEEKWKRFYDKFHRDFKDASLSPKSISFETETINPDFDYKGRALEIKHELLTDTMDWYFSAAPEIKKSKNVVELYNENFINLVQKVVFQPNAKNSNEALREAIEELLEEGLPEQHILNYLKYGMFVIKYSKYICDTYGGEILDVRTNN